MPCAQRAGWRGGVDLAPCSAERSVIACTVLEAGLGVRRMNGVIRAVTDVVIPAAAVVATVVGILFAQNYRRQMALKLSETRFEAYSRLWELTGIAAPTRLDGWGDGGYLEPGERRDLWAAMTDWYYAKGGGMLLADVTKQVYLNVKHDLVCKPSCRLRPADLADQITTELHLPEGCELDEEVRGTLAIRLISLLRTQLKSDLTIYGPTYSGNLNKYECFFLDKSGVNLRSKAWKKAARSYTRWRRLRRLRDVVDRLQEAEAARLLTGRSLKRKPQDPLEPGQPQPSPLRKMSPILDVGKECQTPASSRTAMRNAFRSGSAGSAEVHSGIPKLRPGRL